MHWSYKRSLLLWDQALERFQTELWRNLLHETISYVLWEEEGRGGRGEGRDVHESLGTEKHVLTHTQNTHTLCTHNTHTPMHTCAHTHLQPACTHTHTHTHTHMHTHTHAHTHTHTCTHTHTHTHTHLVFKQMVLIQQILLLSNHFQYQHFSPRESRKHLFGGSGMCQ